MLCTLDLETNDTIKLIFKKRIIKTALIFKIVVTEHYFNPKLVKTN